MIFYLVQTALHASRPLLVFTKEKLRKKRLKCGLGINIYIISRFGISFSTLVKENIDRKLWKFIRVCMTVFIVLAVILIINKILQL
jgi:hypothetical protein